MRYENVMLPNGNISRSTARTSSLFPRKPSGTASPTVTNGVSTERRIDCSSFFVEAALVHPIPGRARPAMLVQGVRPGLKIGLRTDAEAADDGDEREPDDRREQVVCDERREPVRAHVHPHHAQLVPRVDLPVLDERVHKHHRHKPARAGNVCTRACSVPVTPRGVAIAVAFLAPHSNRDEQDDRQAADVDLPRLLQRMRRSRHDQLRVARVVRGVDERGQDVRDADVVAKRRPRRLEREAAGRVQRHVGVARRRAVEVERVPDSMNKS